MWQQLNTQIHTHMQIQVKGFNERSLEISEFKLHVI